MSASIDELEEDLSTRRDRERRRFYGRNHRPKRIGKVVANVMTSRGYGRTKGNVALAEAWQMAVGELAARFSHAGRVNRGRLEVVVSNSSALQELEFQKEKIVRSLQDLLPQAGIIDVRFRSGRLPTD